MKNYNHKKIETKWQKFWSENNTYQTANKSKLPKCYVLDMFPYPSGAGLHVGHPKGYIATDIYSRLKTMQGHNVLHPMGWDAFGLPAENYAIKNKIHPKKAVTQNIARYKKQLKMIGLNYDWNREIDTTDPAYYKWTQWIFLQMFKQGLAYESNEPINWCPSCQTGLANEDLEDGKCERCGSEIEQKPMRQWVLKITKYADRLLADLTKLDWPEHIKESQRNWIGRSEGLLFSAPVKDLDLALDTFSTHFEAFYADTFVVIAPDHPLLKTLIEGVSNQKEILDFCDRLIKNRLSKNYDNDKEPAGIFTGRYIVDPVGNGDLPIWVASYAIADYGTGIVKASCHDVRDFAFAKKYKIKLKPVLFPEDKELATKVKNLEICYTDMQHGLLTEPQEFAGKIAGQHRTLIADFAVKKGLAKKKITYKLRDWVFSRQRYWGEPIPLIHCAKCGVVPVPDEDLPVKLPKVNSYEPTGNGESPLANIKKWVNTTCPKCKGKGKRETNTMPQWAGSSWYYLRYMDPTNDKKLVDPLKEKYWAPVDVYVGGTEHATRHLIYARFWHKFLYDMKVVSTLEPFKRIGKSLGLILGEDGRKMSKRWGNVVNPDEVIDLYGADSLRLYEMFMGPFDGEIAWSTKNIIGVRRFLDRVFRLQAKIKADTKIDLKLENLINQTILKVETDINTFSFNTAISALMILVNALEKEENIRKTYYMILLQLLAPFAPHLTEELWSKIALKTTSIHKSSWPIYDKQKIKNEEITIAIQINGKTKEVIKVKTGLNKDSLMNIVKANPKIKAYLKAKTIKKEIVIPDKIVNLVLG